MPAITSTIVAMTAIGTALGATGAAATLIGGGVLGAAGFGVSKAVQGLTSDNDKQTGSTYMQAPVETTGKLSDETAEDIVKKKMFRSGTVFTSPMGILGDTSNSTTQARLK